MKDKNLLWVCITLICVTGLSWLIFYYAVLNYNNIISETNSKLLSEQNLKSDCRVIRDSLSKLTIDLSKYKTLTFAMVHRDEVAHQLKHSVGEIVCMKNDSSKVVIEDIIIGGGKHNYYVKFKVLCKDNTMKEIVPELIY